MRLAVGALPGFVLLATLGCAGSLFDFSGKEDALEDAQKRYTALVRWGEIMNASAFVDPAITADFLSAADRLKHIRFTEFESGPLRFSEDSKTATVNVVYHAYSTRTLVEKRFREHQQWYREESAGNGWRVRPNLAALAGELSGSR
jgi:hypothetical protein